MTARTRTRSSTGSVVSTRSRPRSSRSISNAARIADLEPEELAGLLAAVRAAGRVAIETGTGVTMAASANVTQWLAWALEILTDSMNRPGGVWFHPGFAHQLETNELPVSSPDGSFGPGPTSRPDTHAFMGEWPCAVLADEIRAGIRAVLNFGGHLLTAFPETNDLDRRYASSRCSPPSRSSPTRRPTSPPTCCPRRISSSGRT